MCNLLAKKAGGRHMVRGGRRTGVVRDRPYCLTSYRPAYSALAAQDFTLVQSQYITLDAKKFNKKTGPFQSHEKGLQKATKTFATEDTQRTTRQFLSFYLCGKAVFSFYFFLRCSRYHWILSVPQCGQVSFMSGDGFSAKRGFF